jgi:hypothetical protein
VGTTPAVNYPVIFPITRIFASPRMHSCCQTRNVGILLVPVHHSCAFFLRKMPAVLNFFPRTGKSILTRGLILMERETPMKKLLFCICFVLCLFAAIPVVSGLGGDEGWIQIFCNVNGASVSFDGQYKGEISGGQLTVPVYTTASPFSSYTVEKSGYYSASGGIVMPAAGDTQTYYATLQPIPTPTPAYGSIVVDSSPSGAAIYLNGNYRGVAPLTIHNVAQGSYTVGAELDGYNPYTTTISVSAGLQSNVYCTLSRIVSSGALYVTSVPSGSMVYLDGNYRGRTPLSLNNIATGSHIVECDLAGYYDWKSTVSVPVGGTMTVTAPLSPIPASTAGWIYVTSNPGGAAVFLDGGTAGTTPASGTLNLNAVTAGDHIIMVKLDGYQDYTTSVNVQPAAVSQVDAVLVPSGQVSPTGILSISSTPSGANVYVDNNLRGVTPLTLTGLSAGAHAVQVQMSGYQAYVETVQVNAGATNTVNTVLNPSTQPTQKSGMPLYVIGIAGIIAGLILIHRRG